MTRVLVDVSRILDVGITSGIQRVVRQVVPRLVAASDDDLQVVMVGWDRTGLQFDVFAEAGALACLAGADGMPAVVGTRAIDEFEAGEVFLDLDAVWSSTLKRSTLYPALRANGVTVVSYVYDMVPLEVPGVVALGPTANWAIWLSAVLAYSDLVLTDSRSAEHDFLAWKERFGVTRPIPTLVTRLGADLPEGVAPTSAELSSARTFIDDPFVLFVGTIEPRKRHLLAVEAFDHLWREHPDVHLVLAGRAWALADDVTSAIREHPAYGRRLHWVDGPSDALLVEIYRRASAALYVSRYEGFGLPIAESLGHGKITVASRNSSMYEVGREASDYTYADSAPEIAGTLAAYLGDPALRAARETYIRETFRPIDWDTVAGTVESALRGLGETRTPQVVRVRDDLIRRPGPVSRSAGVAALDRGGFELLGYDDPPALDEAWQADVDAWVDEQGDVSGLDPAVLALNHAVTRHPTAFTKVFDVAADDDLQARTLALRSRDGLAHGMVSFDAGDARVLVSGLPRLIAAESGATVSLEVSCQVLGTPAGSLMLLVEGDDGPLGEVALPASTSYDVGLQHLPVHADARGTYDVRYLLLVDGRPVAASYDARLVVVEAGAGPDAVEAAIAPTRRRLLNRLRGR